MNDLAIMYHYVRERSGWSGIHPLIPKDFEKQIEEISKYYEIVSPDDLGKKGGKPKCVISFDDGTKDQYTNAFEVLKKKGIPGYFTVMSGPLVHNEIPIFHLVHKVLSMYSDEEIWNDLNEQFKLIDIESKSAYYSYETDLFRRYNKYVLNFYLNEQQSRQFLEERVIASFGSKKDFIESFYITKDEFIQIKSSGMSIGVHCVNHRPYNGDPITYFESEIAPCEKFIREELKITPRWYTPAFGGGEKYKEMILELEPILKNNGFVGAFTTIQGFNDGLSNFWLNRYDCINVPPVANITMSQFMKK